MSDAGLNLGITGFNLNLVKSVDGEGEIKGRTVREEGSVHLKEVSLNSRAQAV